MIANLTVPLSFRRNPFPTRGNFKLHKEVNPSSKKVVAVRRQGRLSRQLKRHTALAAKRALISNHLSAATYRRVFSFTHATCHSREPLLLTGFYLKKDRPDMHCAVHCLPLWTDPPSPSFGARIDRRLRQGRGPTSSMFPSSHGIMRVQEKRPYGEG